MKNQALWFVLLQSINDNVDGLCFHFRDSIDLGVPDESGC
jgi:hypothetical protein